MNRFYKDERMHRTHNTFGLMSLALAAALAVSPALAQRGLGQGKNKAVKRGVEKPRKAPPLAGQPHPGKAAVPPAQNSGAPIPSKPNIENPVPPKLNNSHSEAQILPPHKNLPPQWMERLQKMTPAEQERFMNNNERFRSLPPERKAQIRERLNEFRQLPPEERQKLRERANVWEKIPADQRKRVRLEILPRWKQMSPESRQEIKRRLNALNGLGEEERAAKLRDPNFVRGLNPSEQAMLRDLSNLRVTPSSGAEGNRQ